MLLDRRFILLAALAIGIATAAPDGRAADPDRALSADSVIAARKAVDRASTLVEDLQDDIVEELVSEKEKNLFRAADESLNELDLLDRALAGKTPTREALYAIFDRADAKVAALVKAVSALSPKRPALTRQAERLRSQSDDLHFLLSSGDASAERQGQVLKRQAKSMASLARRFATGADYALLDRPGRAPFLEAVKTFAERCQAFDTVAAAGDLDASKKEFASLTTSWGQVVDGFLRLSPKEDYHIARQGFRLDKYHRQLFELLKMPGKRPVLSMKL